MHTIRSGDVEVADPDGVLAPPPLKRTVKGTYTPLRTTTPGGARSTVPGGADRNRLADVRAFALVEVGDDWAIDVFIRSDDAFAALEDCTTDEPDWIGLLYFAPIELDERDVSAN